MDTAADRTLPQVPRPPLRERLATLLRERGIAARELGRRAGLGNTTVQHILDGTSLHPRSDTLERLAGALDLPVQSLLEETAGASGGMVALHRRESGSASIPVYGVPSAPKVGTFFLNRMELTKLLPPRVLMFWPGAFAFYAYDDAMAPRWKAGEVVLVQPDRTPSEGDHVIVEAGVANGQPIWVFRRLVRRDGDHVILAAYNQALFPEPLRLKGLMQRVVDWPELV